MTRVLTTSPQYQQAPLAGWSGALGTAYSLVEGIIDAGLPYDMDDLVKGFLLRSMAKPGEFSDKKYQRFREEQLLWKRNHYHVKSMHI